LPCRPKLWQALIRHRETVVYNDPDDFVFATTSGRPIDGSNILKWFKQAAREAGIERPVWVHMLRHTLGTRAAERGLTALELAALLGHAQASTSERYIHLAAGADRDRAEELARWTLG
jgi:site-specific recombinase XerD